MSVNPVFHDLRRTMELCSQVVLVSEETPSLETASKLKSRAAYRFLHHPFPLLPPTSVRSSPSLWVVPLKVYTTNIESTKRTQTKVATSRRANTPKRGRFYTWSTLCPKTPRRLRTQSSVRHERRPQRSPLSVDGNGDFASASSILCLRKMSLVASLETGCRAHHHLVPKGRPGALHCHRPFLTDG